MEISLLFIFTLLPLAVITYLILKANRTPLFYSFIGLQLMFFCWIGSLLGELFFPDSSFFVAVNYIPWCFVGTIWMIFCLHYVDANFLKLKWAWKYFLFLSMIPLSNYVMIVADKTNTWVYSYIYVVSMSLDFVYVTLGLILLVQYSKKQSGMMKKQTIVLSALFFSLLIFSLIDFIYKLNKLNKIYSVLFYTLGALLVLFLTIATLRFRFLNLVPIALRKIVDQMKEAIAVVDNFNKIIVFNQQFVELYGLDIRKNDDFAMITKVLIKKAPVSDAASIGARELWEVLEGVKVGNCQGEICIRGPEKKYYLVEIQLITEGKKENLGRIISFRDISDYKKLNQELHHKNDELTVMNDILRNANHKLQEHAATVEELAIARERNRIARDVHDTLGHTLSLLVTILQVTSISCKKDADQTEKKLQEGMVLARKGLEEVRRSVTGLGSNNMESKSWIDALEELVSTFQNTGMTIDFVMDDIDQFLQPEVTGVIYRVCQEALTNSLRHGKATEVNIVLKRVGCFLKLFIIDNGIGCRDLDRQKGFGLTGMCERVESLKGTISFGSDGEYGFNIWVEIPIEVQNDNGYVN
ncbi:MAG TPA: histidine kinase [Bacillota bacterium]|nr:histidine kinase [Bacillota bacterium]